VSPDRVNVRPVEVLEQGLAAATGGDVPTVIEAVERPNRAGHVPIHTPGSVTNPNRQPYVACHLRKERHRGNIRVEGISLVKPLPVDKPEEFLFDEWPAGAEPDLMPVEGRIPFILAVRIEVTSLGDGSSHILV